MAANDEKYVAGTIAKEKASAEPQAKIANISSKEGQKILDIMNLQNEQISVVQKKTYPSRLTIKNITGMECLRTHRVGHHGKARLEDLSRPEFCRADSSACPWPRVVKFALR